jgi:hypothetical protein
MAEKLLFVDTNIWLDFYRAQNDAGLKLLKHVEAVKTLLVTYQLEVEFKKNRQTVLKNSWENLKAPNEFGVPNIVADAQTTQMLKRHMREAKQRVDALKKMIVRALESPARHDPVYQAAQRMFHRESDLVLTRKNNVRKVIRTKSLRRFLQGYPPRKNDDTSMGDGFNWEWMIHCAAARKADLVIISRDGDFGVTIHKKCHFNDHLQQEYKERVGRRRKVVLFDRLTDGLTYMKVAVSKKEVDAEREWLRGTSFSAPNVERVVRIIKKYRSMRGVAVEEALGGPLLLEAPQEPQDET